MKTIDFWQLEIVYLCAKAKNKYITIGQAQEIQR